MPEISLKDILIGARQEAYRMRHFYVGAEHLFIALLEIKGSIISSIIKDHGLTPEYVIDAIRRKIGKGGKHRLWAGIPNTPRAEILLSIANDLAMEHGREEITERDLLIAILEESDSIPLRVLQALGISEINQLEEVVKAYSLNSDSQRPYVKVEFNADFVREDMLTKEQLFILRRMFYGYPRIRVERQLTGGYSNALLLVVTPIHGDNREDSPVVAKINHVDTILDEAQRYESHVKSKLPPMTARLEDKPVAPEMYNLAGIRYTLVADYDRIPQDLRSVMHDWDAEQLGSWLRTELFPVFGRVWWQQRRPYRFQVWREYDWLLPPLLTLEMVKESDSPLDVHTLKMPVKRTKLYGIEYGDIVAVESFIIQKVHPEKNIIELAVGHGTDSAKAYKIEMRGVDLALDTYYRGEVVERIMGRVWKTRHEQLIHAVRSLEPEFDPQADRISVFKDADEKLPNPIVAYESLLDRYINGSLSTIHGDLHPGNIMIGPNHSAFLIDFAHTRDGHTLFDWATLETSILSDYVMAKTGETWEDARHILQQLILLNKEQLQPGDNSPIEAVCQIREIAKECLATNGVWTEYLIALAFCGLRAITWETIPLGGRRLMFLVAAQAIHELQTIFHAGGEAGIPSSDETEINTT